MTVMRKDAEETGSVPAPVPRHSRSVRKFGFLVAVLGMGGTLFAGVLWLAVLLTPLPNQFRTIPPSPRVTSRDGILLHEGLSPSQTRGGFLPLSLISPHLVQATLAGEDHRFFHHHGVDPQALARAAWLNLRAGRWAYGGSTLTQQLARLCLPGPRTFSQKLREAFWALVLEHHLSKEQILEQYLARAPYGGLLTGIDAASQAYFRKPPNLLSLAESSLLAALPRAPDHYDLRRFQGRALQRRTHLLSLMVKRGMITADQAAAAEEEPLQPSTPTVPLHAPHAVRRVLARTPPSARQVSTTLDFPLQQRAEELARLTVAELADRGVTQAAALVVELPGGHVRALVGSADFLDPLHGGQVDGTQALRSPGSALKPLVYAAALDAGLITPSTVLADVSQPFPAASGVYLPRNFDEREHGPVLVRTALACSYNLAAVDLAARLGPAAMLEMLGRFGLPLETASPEDLGLGLILGGVEVRLWDLAEAYLALATGNRTPLTLVPVSSPLKPVPVISKQAAWIAWDILSDDLARSPAFGRGSALNLPFPAAVKTGTSKDFRDNWALGFSSRFLVAAWVGDFTGAPMHGVSGVTGAGTLWHRLMRSVHAGFDPAPMPRPDRVLEAEVCSLSGARPGPSCPPSPTRGVHAWHRSPEGLLLSSRPGQSGASLLVPGLGGEEWSGLVRGP